MIEIAYDQNNHLKITPQGHNVLTGKQQVTLAQFIFERTENTKITPKTPQANRQADTALMSRLKALRKDIAKIQGIAPYMVFSDKTLHEIAIHKPTDKESFAMIHGIGEYKTERYWEHFTRQVRLWQQNKLKGL